MNAYAGDLYILPSEDTRSYAAFRSHLQQETANSLISTAAIHQLPWAERLVRLLASSNFELVQRWSASKRAMLLFLNSCLKGGRG